MGVFWVPVFISLILMEGESKESNEILPSVFYYDTVTESLIITLFCLQGWD